MSFPPKEEQETFLEALGGETLNDGELIRKLGWDNEKYYRVKKYLLATEKIELIGPLKFRQKEVIPIKWVEREPPKPCSKEDIWAKASELYREYENITKQEVRKDEIYETPKWTVFNWVAYLYWACRKYGSYLLPFSDEEYHDPSALKDYDTPQEFVESEDGLKTPLPLAEDYRGYEEMVKEEKQEEHKEELRYLAERLKTFRREELREEDIHLLSGKHMESYEKSIIEARKQRDEARREAKELDREIEDLKWELRTTEEALPEKKPPPPKVRWTKELEGKLQDRYYATLDKLGVKLTTVLRARFRDEIPEFEKIETEKEMFEAAEELAYVIQRERAIAEKRPLREPPEERPPREVRIGPPEEEEEFYVEVPPAEFPIYPEKGFFPSRRLTSLELIEIENKYYQDVYGCGKNPDLYRREFEEWIETFLFDSWDQVKKNYESLIDIVCYGKKIKLLPRALPAEVIDELVHWLVSLKQYNTIEEIQEQLELMGKTASKEDVVIAIRTGYEQKVPNFVIVTRQYLEKLLGEPLT